MNGHDEEGSEERRMDFDAVDSRDTCPPAVQQIEAEQLEIIEKMKKAQGELILLMPCHVPDCSHNFKDKNPTQHLVETIIKPPIFTPPIDDFPELPPAPVNNPIANAKSSEIPTTTSNKLSALAGATANIDLDSTPVPVANKITPIMLRYSKNYKLLLQQLVKDFPESTNKLTGDYIRIIPATEDDRRKIIDYLKSINEQFYVFDPPASRPHKKVLKGLPTSTDIQDFKSDLENRGFIVERVAQLTKSRTKSPLPIFMTEIKKFLDSPEPNKINKCCHMIVKTDTFRRRPGPTQCFNG
ncbi:PRE_C2HC domain-containing protein [Trichonephila clavipes]|nr:PRE_C2HC domain-containing protein [Trichonephila clavipes]